MKPTISTITQKRASQLLKDADCGIKSGTLKEWRAIAMALAQRNELLLTEIKQLHGNLRHVYDVAKFHRVTSEQITRIILEQTMKGTE